MASSSNLIGKWSLEETENINNYLKELGEDYVVLLTLVFDH